MASASGYARRRVAHGQDHPPGYEHREAFSCLTIGHSPQWRQDLKVIARALRHATNGHALQDRNGRGQTYSQQEDALNMTSRWHRVESGTEQEHPVACKGDILIRALTKASHTKTSQR
ncbi:hypothetical protein VPNG_02801 [Cytospora leucostoma]|uniref:Uncharacterized protein n=1 Tax=Cytospora leucostoma TaxID=1230097 RepID=A0A423XJD6_9PEZI|nr:hypothetical protein VPNG_02801 [Cytospora leucostoma]